MNAFVVDNFIDVAGTSGVAHSPEVGGPISAISSAAAVITSSNRLRGQAQGTLTYSVVPASSSYSAETSIFVASNSNGVGISLSGISFSYSISNGYWNLAGTGVPSGGHVDQALNVGQSYKIKLAIDGNTVTGSIDGLQIVQKNSSQTIIPVPVGLFFLATDTDSTGYQFESVVALQGEELATTGANEIQVKATSGLTLYAVAVSPSGLYFATSGYEALNVSHWTTYAIPLTEAVAGTGVYFGSIPSGVPQTLTLLPIYQQAGSTPVSTDVLLTECGRPVTLALGWVNGVVSIQPVDGKPGRTIQVPAVQNSLSFAQMMLGKWLGAESTMASSGVVSVTIDGEQTVFSNPSTVTSKVVYWQNRVNILSGARKRVSTIRMF